MGGAIKKVANVASLGLTDKVGLFDEGDGGAGAAKKAAQIQADSQKESLDYLKEINALPQQYKEQALTQLGGLYGGEGGMEAQQGMIDQAMASPLYQQIMGTQQLGEDAIMRNQSMTGGLRSGNTQANMYQYNQQLGNKALLDSYNQQLSGIKNLAGLSTNENQIAQGITGIGTTQGQGILAASQMQQNATAQENQNWMNLAGMGAMAFSDNRLKDNIVEIDKVNGHRVFRWVWNKAAEAIGLSGEGVGVLAHLVNEYKPEAIGIHKNGYLTVDYSQLGA